MFYNNDSSSSDFSMEEVREAIKKVKELHAKHDMVQSGCNMDMLSQRCNVCNHIPTISGGIGNNRMEVCEHQLQWMEDNIDPPENPVRDFPAFLGDGFNGIEIVLRNKEERK